MGKLPISEKQAHQLEINPCQRIRISPYLTECCLRASAKVSYENAAEDVAYYTGIIVSGKTQQRLFHRHQFGDIECNLLVGEISVGVIAITDWGIIVEEHIPVCSS